MSMLAGRRRIALEYVNAIDSGGSAGLRQIQPIGGRNSFNRREHRYQG